MIEEKAEGKGCRSTQTTELTETEEDKHVYGYRNAGRNGQKK